MFVWLALTGVITAAAPPALHFAVASPPGVQVAALAGSPDGSGLFAVGTYQRDAVVVRLAESGEVLWTKQFGDPR